MWGHLIMVPRWGSAIHEHCVYMYCANNHSHLFRAHNIIWECVLTGAPHYPSCKLSYWSSHLSFFVCTVTMGFSDFFCFVDTIYISLKGLPLCIVSHERCGIHQSNSHFFLTCRRITCSHISHSVWSGEVIQVLTGTASSPLMGDCWLVTISLCINDSYQCQSQLYIGPNSFQYTSKLCVLHV